MLRRVRLMASRKTSAANQSFQSLYTHGFVRVAACAPVVAPANPAENATRILKFWREADAEKAAVLLTPELSLCGYAIDDLFLQESLLDAVEVALAQLKAESEKLFPILIVGAPIRLHGALYNCAVLIHRGEVLGIVPKSFLPNYREFYEKRYFGVASDKHVHAIPFLDGGTNFGANQIFYHADNPDFSFHVEICEDFWAPTPPSTKGALAGANILFNLSASNVTIGKAEDRAVLCDSQSRRAIAAYVFAAGGYGESTTDLAWDGQIIAYEWARRSPKASASAASRNWSPPTSTSRALRKNAYASAHSATPPHACAMSFISGPASASSKRFQPARCR